MQGRRSRSRSLFRAKSSPASWSVAKHLELLPPLQKNLPISQDEEMLLRKVQAGEMKIEELIAKIKKGQTSEPDKDRF